MEAWINEIIPLSFVDGPGSRLALFFQGCQLRCVYCHNPEARALCDGCGDCVPVCPHQALVKEPGRVAHLDARCHRCDRCLLACSRSSTPRAVRLSLDGAMRHIARAAPFIDGVTCSGGECTDQHAFVGELGRRLRQELPRLSLLAHTHGAARPPVYEQLAATVSGFIVDLKAANETLHRALTGSGNAAVLATIEQLACRGLLVEIRTVLVPGYTDTAAEVEAMAHRVGRLAPGVPWKLVRYRPQGVRGALGEQSELDPARYAALCAVAGVPPDPADRGLGDPA